MTAEEPVRVAIEESGAGALVLPSLFEEQVVAWNARLGREQSTRQSGTYEPTPVTADPAYGNAEVYLAMVNRASIEHSIPVIASLNGQTTGSWIEIAGELQEVGAAAIELSLYHPPAEAYSSPREMEDQLVEAAKRLKASITVPLFLKLDHAYTSLPHLCSRLLSGADGLVLFGRRPDTNICLDSLATESRWALTQAGSCEQSLGAIMRAHTYCPAMPLAASGGISSPEDLAKVLLAGADVGMVTSAIYRGGAGVVASLLDGLRQWMSDQQISSMIELYQKRPLQFASDTERSKYIAALSSRPRMTFSGDDATGRPQLQGDRFGHPIGEQSN